ncbi:thiol:disulfide interchange protein DsbA/DsbL [Rivibacter subsaxonicus]|uniref:Thiol:disulfide interchange protein n=1 Tax=Rivibacter subsaxonicus TaxID=457575 RepID=A0A4V2FUA1_9BURK|nr:thiol:disulfide interchange protein DsbA/DsbL [Rivibacter subsaxonicus]RZU01226.1 thiol:disulfide interchange protein DsbA [Rivibacter subsaxonicus]
MNRREFSTLGAATIAALGTNLAVAQPVAGTNFLKLSQPQPTLDANKIEVLEFFSYSCPHCFAFEPAIDTWSRKLPADVLFRRMPVAFREVPFVLHQKLYFAIETLGLVDTLHRKVFAAIHVERNPLDTPEKVLDFVAKNGVDRAKFADVMNSFGVATKARQASTLTAGYKVDGTPAMGINGRFYTSGTLAGGNEASLAVTDYLVAQIRKTKG